VTRQHLDEGGISSPWVERARVAVTLEGMSENVRRQLESLLARRAARKHRRDQEIAEHNRRLANYRADDEREQEELRRFRALVEGQIENTWELIKGLTTDDPKAEVLRAGIAERVSLLERSDEAVGWGQFQGGPIAAFESRGGLIAGVTFRDERGRDLPARVDRSPHEIAVHLHDPDGLEVNISIRSAGGAAEDGIARLEEYSREIKARLFAGTAATPYRRHYEPVTDTRLQRYRRDIEEFGHEGARQLHGYGERHWRRLVGPKSGSRR
jgi:hypothetical protein